MLAPLWGFGKASRIANLPSLDSGGVAHYSQPCWHSHRPWKGRVLVALDEILACPIWTLACRLDSMPATLFNGASSNLILIGNLCLRAAPIQLWARSNGIWVPKLVSSEPFIARSRPFVVYSDSFIVCSRLFIVFWRPDLIFFEPDVISFEPDVIF